MSDNFEKITPDFSNPSLIRNFLADMKNDCERKNHSLLFHIIYAVLCAAAICLACGTESGILSRIFMFTAPGMCVYTFLYSPLILKLFPTVLSPVFILIKELVSGAGVSFNDISRNVLVYLLCILGAAVICKAVISGYTKISLFVLLSCVFGAIYACGMIFSFIAEFGTFSFSLLLSEIDKSFENVISQSVEILRLPENLEYLRSLALSGETMTDEEIIKLFEQSLQLSVVTVKPCLVSLFAMSCMLYGFAAVAVFSLFARRFRINVFVCIMDEKWTYRPSLISAAVYDIVFFAFIIGMFVPLPQSISVTVINLMLVLTPVMFVCGIRDFWCLFTKKSGKTKAAILLIALLAVLTALTGGLTFLIAASAGVSFITMKNREERITAPLKYAADLAFAKKMSSCEDVSERENQANTQDNR